MKLTSIWLTVFFPYNRKLTRWLFIKRWQRVQKTRIRYGDGVCVNHSFKPHLNCRTQFVISNSVTVCCIRYHCTGYSCSVGDTCWIRSQNNGHIWNLDWLVPGRSSSPSSLIAKEQQKLTMLNGEQKKPRLLMSRRPGTNLECARKNTWLIYEPGSCCGASSIRTTLIHSDETSRERYREGEREKGPERKPIIKCTAM